MIPVVCFLLGGNSDSSYFSLLIQAFAIVIKKQLLITKDVLPDMRILSHTCTYGASHIHMGYFVHVWDNIVSRTRTWVSHNILPSRMLFELHADTINITNFKTSIAALCYNFCKETCR